LHEREVIWPRERRQRDRDRADLHGAEKRGDEFRRIAQDQRDAFAAPEAALAEPARRRVLQRGELRVRDRVPAEAEGRSVPASGRADRIRESAGEIERG